MRAAAGASALSCESSGIGLKGAVRVGLLHAACLESRELVGEFFKIWTLKLFLKKLSWQAGRESWGRGFAQIFFFFLLNPSIKKYGTIFCHDSEKCCHNAEFCLFDLTDFSAISFKVCHRSKQRRQGQFFVWLRFFFYPPRGPPPPQNHLVPSILSVLDHQIGMGCDVTLAFSLSLSIRQGLWAFFFFFCI